MNTRILLFIITFCITPLASAELIWTADTELWNKKPSQTTAPQKHQANHSMQHGRPREKAFFLLDAQQARVRFIAPDLVTQVLEPREQNKYIMPKTGMDNYHALIAEQEQDKTIEASLRYVYMRGKPSGHSPSELVQHPKLALEVIPNPMIREHWHFYTQNKHAFIIKYNNKPLKDNWVVLQTSNGTTLDGKTNDNGEVTFILPDDFKQVKPGRRANKPAEFVIRTTHIDKDRHYKSNFTASYYVNPSHWKSSTGGILALSLGFITGLVLLRKYNNNPSSSKKTGKVS